MYSLWSLALEEQFCSIWPVVVFFVSDRRKLIRICFGGILSAFLVRICLVWSGVTPWAAYVELPARMDSLLAGAWLALAFRGPSSSALLNRRLWYSILGASVIGLAGVCALAKTTFFLSRPMETAGFTILVLMSTSSLTLSLIDGSMINRVGQMSILRFFGKYSYGLYGWHMLPYPICERWLGSLRSSIHVRVVADTIYVAAMLGLFTGCAVLSYWVVEVHFLRMKPRYSTSALRASGRESEYGAHEALP